MNFEIIRSGGPLMIPLFFISIFALAIILERFLTYKKMGDFKDQDFIRLKSFLMAKNFDQASGYLKQFSAPVIPVFEAIFKDREKTKEEIEISAELESIKSTTKIYQTLSLLKILPNLSTMTGLLGTVLGMIKNFAIVSKVGTGDPTALASGISEALITTATGLFIAIPIIFFYAILENKAGTLEEKLQIYASEVIKLIK